MQPINILGNTIQIQKKSNPPFNEQSVSADELKVRIDGLIGSFSEAEGFKNADEVEEEAEKKTSFAPR